MRHRNLLGCRVLEPLSQIAEITRLVGRQPDAQFSRLCQHIGHAAPGDVDGKSGVSLQLQRRAELVDERGLILELAISDRNRSDGQLPEPMDRLAVEVIPLLSWLTGFAQI
jgi:hypothetical protein